MVLKKEWRMNFLCVDGFWNFQGLSLLFLIGPYIVFIINQKKY